MKSFNSAAHTYALHADVQALSLKQLGDNICKKGFYPERILDIGCGPGNSTEFLLDRYPDAFVTGLDVSREMIAQAKSQINDDRVDWVVSDIDLFEAFEGVDLLFSNATFQWVSDTVQLINRLISVVPKGGCLAFSCYGPKTFQELGEVLDISLPAQSFADLSALDIAGLEVKQDIIVRPFESFIDLLKYVKKTGIRGSDSTGIWSRRRMLSIESQLLERYGWLPLTFQVFYGIFYG